MGESRIIAIRSANPEKARLAFKDFMQRTEDFLNDRAASDPSAFRKINAYDLEKLSVKSMQEVCVNTPFSPSDISLVSGQTFPDIIAACYYGVEVKSTKSDHWKSTGGSIIESTRNASVEDIYMLFGKLGGTPKFKCRPYQDCLYDIAVTHSPRYLIDMNIGESETIFSKMGISYDDLRASDDSISQVRKYYRKKTKGDGKKNVAWWLNDKEEENQSIVVNLFGALPNEVKEHIKLEMLILFPIAIIDGDYSEVAMWLLSRHNSLCYNMRDVFSAGGKADLLNGKKMATPVPRIVKVFLDSADKVREIIDTMRPEIAQCDPQLLQDGDLFQNWIKLIDEECKKRYGRDALFRSWYENGDVLSKSKKVSALKDDK